ncbi:MAG: hypothetical protein ACR2QE_08230 [Acidimicrobiales bacterium]
MSVLVTMLALVASSCAVIVRSSVDTTGVGQPNGGSAAPALSGDGRFVAFGSSASNLVAGDNNGTADIFVRDHQTETTELISASINGGSGNGSSERADITPDGRFVTFASFANDLVAGDTNPGPDVFLHDRQTGITEIVSVDSSENQGMFGSLGGTVSDDGRFVAFHSVDQFDNDTNSTFDVYLRDRSFGLTRIMSTESTNTTAAGDSFDGVVSGDGSTVVWWSFSDDIVAGDTNGEADVFWRTTVLLIKLRISEPNGGGQGDGPSRTPDVSHNGSFVVFDSGATNLVAGDTNGVDDVFLWDINLAIGDPLIRISERPDGTQGNDRSLLAKINGDGDHVAYMSHADNLQDPAAAPADSNGERDAYLWNLGTNTLGSQTTIGEATNDVSLQAAISADGSALAFDTEATNLGFDDTNGATDVVVRPTFVPDITGVTGGPWMVGETSELKLLGTFTADSEVIVGGDGVLDAQVTAVDPGVSVTIEVTTTGVATPGVRPIWIITPAPQLGIQFPFGSADQIDVALLP